VANFVLKSETPLEGAALSFDGIAAEEITGRAIVSVAVPNGHEAKLQAAIEAAYGVTLPAVGNSISSGDNLILRLARDQFWLLFEDTGERPEPTVRDAVGTAGYIVDQSDGWAVARVSGPMCREALERICPLDLAPNAFEVRHVARTIMEHLSIIIHREAEDAFLLLSPRSSANSFWHTLEVSARNVT